MFRGNADFVFYQRDLFTPQVRWLKLTVKRSGEAFEFMWRFEDTVASRAEARRVLPCEGSLARM